MWEDAAPMQEREPPRPPARPRSEEDLVLWAQILLCLAAVGFELAAKLLGWPAYPVLRRAFAAATQPEQSLLLGEERGLLKFTEQTAEELANSARSMWDDFTARPRQPARPTASRHRPPTPARTATPRTLRSASRCRGTLPAKPPAMAGAPTPWAAWATISTLAMTWQQPGHGGTGRRRRRGAHGGQP